MNRRVLAFAILLLVNLVGTSTICYLTYRERRDAYLFDTVALLRAATAYGEHVSQVDLPDAPITTTPLPVEDALATKYFTRYAETTEIANLYTMVEDASGRVVFTECSSTIPVHPGQVYTSAPGAVHEAFRTKQSTIASYKDEFGHWRSMFTPVQSVKGGAWFVVGADVATERIERTNVLRLWNTIEIAAGAFVLMSLVGAFFLSKMVRRTGALVGVMEEFVRTDFKREGGVRERLDALVAARKDDVAVIASAVERMAIALDGYIERLTATMAAKDRIESELKIAHEIQLGLLPKRFPPFPDRPEFELYALIQPAKEVGGDLYDFFWIDDEHLFFVIGDVSDKGVPAALFMAVTKTLLKTHVRDTKGLAEALARVNDYLVDGNDSMMFVTIFAAILDVRTGDLEYCDGGHNPPYVLRRGGRAELLVKCPGVALGFSPGFKFESAKIHLDRGDTIFLYTDGVTEAMNDVHDQFSEDRLQPALGELTKEPLDDLLHAVMKRVSTFVAGAPQSDDIAMLALRYVGERRAAKVQAPPPSSFQIGRPGRATEEKAT